MSNVAPSRWKIQSRTACASMYAPWIPPQRWSAWYWSRLPSVITGSSAGSDSRSLASAASKSSNVSSAAGSTPAASSFFLSAKTPTDWPVWATAQSVPSPNVCPSSVHSNCCNVSGE